MKGLSIAGLAAGVGLVVGACTPPPGVPEQAHAQSPCLIVPSTEHRDPLVDGLMTGGIHAFETLAEHGYGSVHWLKEETDGTGIGAERAFLRCYDRGATIVVGPFAPADVDPVVRVAGAHEVVLIVPTPGGMPTHRAERNLFAVAPPVETMGAAAATDAGDRCDAAPCAILHVSGSFGERVADAFVEGARGSDHPPIRRALPEAAQDWADAAVEAGRSGARGLLVVGEVDHAAAVVAQLARPELAETVVWLAEPAFGVEALQAVPIGAEGRVRVLRAAENSDPALRTSYTGRWQRDLQAPAVAGYEALRLGALLAQQDRLPDWSSRATWLRRRELAGSAFGPTRFVEFDGLAYEEAAGYQVFDLVRLRPDADPELRLRRAGDGPPPDGIEP